MKRNILILTVMGVVGIFTACSSSHKIQQHAYVPDNKELYDTLVALDSIFFDAYNRCDLDKMGSMISDSIEFYHDQGGLMTSKEDILGATKRNICGKVTRELIKGSIEVYPIHGFGAVQIGLHRFHNNQEPPGTPLKIGKFIHTWQYKNGKWQLKRVISLH